MEANFATGVNEEEAPALCLGVGLTQRTCPMRLKSMNSIVTAVIPHNAKNPTVGILAALLLSACGGGGSSNGNPTPSPQGSYNLQAAMGALIKSGLTANVSLSGTAIVNGTSNPFTGTGTLTLIPGAGDADSAHAAHVYRQRKMRGN